jgi:hypothetical protein
MKIMTDELHDEVSILGLKDVEYTIVFNALMAAANDINRKTDYVVFYGAERDEVVKFFNKIKKEDDGLPS